MLRFCRNGVAALAIAVVSLIGVAGPSSAQESLRSIGSLTYTPAPIEEQRGIFNLRPEDQVMRALRIEAVSGSAEIRELRLVYRGGEIERVRMGDRLRPGSLTNTVRINDPRPLQRIEVVFVPSGSVTLVLRAETRRPEPPQPVAKWSELGCKNVGFAIDRDVLNVTSTEPYRALRLRSTGYDLEMIDMTVTYVNGQRDLYRLNLVIPSGSYTSPIDLRGERRRIRNIEMVYRTNVLSNRKTQLCVDGLRANPE